MSVLMEDDSVIKVTISLRVGPKIHLHPGTAPIWGSIKVCIICAPTILRFCVDMISSFAAVPIVVELEIPCFFIKSIGVKEVVGDIVPVK